MQQVVTHPDGVRDGLKSSDAIAEMGITLENLAETIRPSEALTAEERLGIYAGMYYLRLQEVLDDVFSGVRHALGGDAFDDLTHRYLARHPSTHWSLNRLSARFPDFVDADPALGERCDFVHDLARLEQAIDEVFDEPQADAVSLDDLLAVPADKWGEARLEFIPAVRLMAFDHPVNDFLQAVYDDSEPELPEPAPTRTLLYRPEFVVLRLDMGPQPATVLGALLEGRSLAESLELCLELPDADPESVLGAIKTWFQDWAAYKIVRALKLTS